MARPESQILTPDKRLRVFISSTLNELAPERAAASEAIATLRLTPILFELGARPHPPQALYRSYLQQSDLFIGIYWESYGWIAPGESISGIEDEYRLSAGKPRLVYVKKPAPERQERLTEFLGTLESEAGFSYKSFTTAEELRELVSRDVALLMTERFHLSAAGGDGVEPRRTLPARATSFVGRRHELAEVERLFGTGARLVTLTGPGGIGKTRTALEAAERLEPRFAEGVAFVPLDGLESADAVGPTIVAALGIADLGGEPMGRLRAHLSTRELLIVLDNFEHVTASAPLVATLVESAPALGVLVTSRELLRLRAEHEVRVPPLPAESEAVALLMDRAAAAEPTLQAGVGDEAAFADICRYLDGVPLAIELAAPRLRLLRPSELRDQLRERLTLTGPRDAPARQRSLDAAIGWSYDLLAPEERRLLERLAVFHGSFTIEAAEEVSDARESLLERLSSLLDKSLVHRLPDAGETRFAMLRMIRDYALERLAERGELATGRERFTAYYLRLAVEADEGCRTTAQRQWKRTLDLEADNFRAALAWAAEHERASDVSVLMRGLWIWFWLHGNVREARDWVARGLATGEATSARDRGWLLLLSGAFAMLEGDFEPAFADLAEAGRLLTEAGDRRGAAYVKLAFGFAGALTKGEEWAQAELSDTLAIFEDLGDLWGIGTTMHAMTRLRTVFGDYTDAGDLFERGVDAVERSGDDFGIALALINLANARLAGGDIDAARSVIGRVLDHMGSTGITYASDDLLDILGRITYAEGDRERATELLAAADRLREQLGTVLWPPVVERRAYLIEELRNTLGGEQFEAAYARGRKLDVPDVQRRAAHPAGAA